MKKPNPHQQKSGQKGKGETAVLEKIAEIVKALPK